MFASGCTSDHPLKIFGQCGCLSPYLTFLLSKRSNTEVKFPHAGPHCQWRTAPGDPRAPICARGSVKVLVEVVELLKGVEANALLVMLGEGDELLGPTAGRRAMRHDAALCDAT